MVVVATLLLLCCALLVLFFSSLLSSMSLLSQPLANPTHSTLSNPPFPLPPLTAAPARAPKAFGALPPGGAFIALDALIDGARARNRWGLFMSLSMLTEFEREGAFDYTFEDFQGWARAAGFSRTELIHLGGPASAAVAYK